MNLNKLNNRITKVLQTLDRKKTSLNSMIVAVFSRTHYNVHADFVK